MTNAGRGTSVFAGILRWILVLLLPALGGSHALAQEVAALTQLPTAQPGTQQSDLQRRAVGTVFRDCADCPEVVVIPPATFGTASPERAFGQTDQEGEGNSAALPSVIAVGRYEVTKAQFARFVRETGHSTRGGCFAWDGHRYLQDASKNWRNPGFFQSDNDPVVCVNRNDAKAYTDWLTKKASRPYRLPTEAEWEYAARAGAQGSRPWGTKTSDACLYANVADASAKREVPGIAASWTFHDCDDGHAYTAPVGSYPPNAFGLYDMLGNAWEWTEDCWDEESAGAPAAGREQPSANCSQGVLRGGGWVDSPAFVSYDFRFFVGAGDRDFYMGFRVARTN